MITVAQEVSPNDAHVRKNAPSARLSFRRLRCLGSLQRVQYPCTCIFTHFFFSTRRPSRWDDPTRTAPLATPETLSEASTSSPPSPVVPVPRPMRRTPKIPGNLSTAADDLKNNLHYAMLSAKNYFLRTAGEHAGGSNNGSSSGNSEASYESAKSLAAAGLPPPVPRRRDSVTVRR